MNKSLYFILIVLLVFGCEEEPPREEIDTSVKLYAYLSDENREIKLRAGENSYYNHTLYEDRGIDVYNFTSKLFHQSDPLMHEYVEVVLYDYNDIGQTIPSDRFSLGKKKVLHHTDYLNGVQVSFQALNYNPAHSYLISIGNDNFDINETHDLAGGEAVMVCMKEIDPAGQDTIHTCKMLSLMTTSNYSPEISIVSNSESSVVLEVNTGQMTCDQWIWDGELGDRIKEYTLDQITNQSHFNLQLMHEGAIRADIVFKLENNEGQWNLHQTDFAIRNLMHNYIESQEMYDRVVVNYYNPEGGVYSSQLATQEATNFFEVIDRDAFHQQANQPTTKLSLEFDLWLSNEMNEKIRLKTEDTKLAFRNPQ